MSYRTLSTSILGTLIVSAGLTLGFARLSSLAAKPGLASVDPAQPTVTGQPLTADQLAGILNLNVWSFDVKGGLIQCWFEIDAAGGKAPKSRRVPEKGFVGYSKDVPPEVLKNRATEGTVLFWFSKNPNGDGGSINLSVSNAGSYGLGLGPNDFTFGWKSFGVTSTSIGKQSAVVAKPGEEIVLVSYDANEGLTTGSKEKPREVHLKLKAKFLEMTD